MEACEHAGLGHLCTVLGGLFKTLSRISGVILWLHDNLMMAVISVFVLIALFLSKELWVKKLYTATFGQVTCPSLLNCRFCGWCIMDVVFPCCCASYHSTFHLRLVIVRAEDVKHAEGIEAALGGHPDLYVEIHCGQNPVKTTSSQPCDRNNTYHWNEPIDLVVRTSDTIVNIYLYNGDRLVADIEPMLYIDDIYEPRGYYSCCGYPLDCRCCAYTDMWPKVVGAPDSDDEADDDAKEFAESQKKLRFWRRCASSVFWCVPCGPFDDIAGWVIERLMGQESPGKKRKNRKNMRKMAKKKKTGILGAFTTTQRRSAEESSDDESSDEESQEFECQPHQCWDWLKKRLCGKKRLRTPHPLALQLKTPKGSPAGTFYAYFILHANQQALPESVHELRGIQKEGYGYDDEESAPERLYMHG